MSMMRLCAALFAALIQTGCGKSADTEGFSHLEVNGGSAIVTNKTPLTVSGPDGFKLIGPYHLRKKTEAGLTLEASLASYVSSDIVVSVPAEHLVPPEGRLDYSDLPPATWPDSTFHTLTSTCMQMTREQAEQLPESTDVQWVLDAGFNPEGAFAVESTIKSSADRNDEISIEIIARVPGCDDATAVAAAIEKVRHRFEVRAGR